MTKWSGRGLRGSLLEEMINYTNEEYRSKKIALIQKIPTPITPVEIDNETRHITLAYFDQQSTVDYIGAVQGVPVCFDAKECLTDTFPLSNVHEHQIRFMREMEEQEGVAFLLLYFTMRQKAMYLPFRSFEVFLRRMEDGGRKSFRFEELDPAYEIPVKNGLYIHYLVALSKDLAWRADHAETEEEDGETT